MQRTAPKLSDKRFYEEALNHPQNNSKESADVYQEIRCNGYHHHNDQLVAAASTPVLHRPAIWKRRKNVGESSCETHVREKTQKTMPYSTSYSVLIVLSAFFLYFFADGAILSFGVFYVELLSYFGEKRSTTAWVGSLFTSVPMLGGPFASFLISRYGCRKVTIVGATVAAAGFALSSLATSVGTLCLTIGLMSGMGLACTFMSAVVAVSFRFKDRRSLATGIVTCGSGIGMFAFAPLTEFLLQLYTWQGACIIMSALFLHMVACGAIFSPPPPSKSPQNSNSEHVLGVSAAPASPLSGKVAAAVVAKQLLEWKVLRNSIYISFWVSNFLLYLSYDTTYLYLTDHATTLGINEADGAFLLSIIGVVNTAGLLVYGYLGDKKAINTIALYSISIILCGVSVIILPFLSTYTTLCTFSAIFGFLISANYTLESVILVKLLGLESFTNAYGLIICGQGGANLVGPPFFGLLRDLTGDYVTSFCLSGGVIILSGLVMIPGLRSNSSQPTLAGQQQPDTDLHSTTYQQTQQQDDSSTLIQDRPKQTTVTQWITVV